MNIDALSDDELMNMEAAPSFTADPEPDQGQEEQQPQENQQEKEAPAGTEGGEAEGSEGGSDADGAEGDGKEAPKPEDADPLSDTDLEKQEAPAVQPEKKEGEQEPKPAQEQQKPAEEKKETPKQEAPKSEGEQQAPTIDYEAEYKKLVGTPIRANGKEITLKSVDEVMRLVQQGAGYSQKMEALKPARRAAAMLEAAGLLGDENALGHMIDAYNGKPEAIARLVKDLKIDLLAMDLDSGDKYTPSGHIQTDEAVNFQDTLKEVRALDGGKEALALIERMDDASKRLIWGNSEAVRQIFEYKQNGVYDTVANELERRRTLGQVPEGKPYIVAFQEVGAELAKASEAAAAASTATEQKSPPVAEPAKPAPRTPIASGPAPQKQQAPDARAAAAASPRSGGGQAKPTLDIYNLSDADIEKMSAPPQ